MDILVINEESTMEGRNPACILSMLITPEIQELLIRAIDYQGSITQLARKLGIAHSTIIFWQSGKTKEISGRVWAQKLRPLLLPFASPEELNRISEDAYVLKQIGASAQIHSSGSQAKEQAALQVVPMTALAEWDPAIDSLDNLAQPLRRESKLDGKDGIWLKLDEPLSAIPAGTLLQVTTDALKNGDAAIAILSTHPQAMLGTYIKTDDKMLLDDGHNQINLREESAKRHIKKLFKVKHAIFPS